MADRAAKHARLDSMDGDESSSSSPYVRRTDFDSFFQEYEAKSC